MGLETAGAPKAIRSRPRDDGRRAYVRLGPVRASDRERARPRKPVGGGIGSRPPDFPATAFLATACLATACPGDPPDPHVRDHAHADASRVPADAASAAVAASRAD